MNLERMITGISPISTKLQDEAIRKINNKTKPIGSLGRLEEIAIKLSLIQNNLNPKIGKKIIFVYAADHGITEETVSAFPKEVTAQMVLNFINKGAAINVLSEHNQIDLKVIDIGVDYDFNDIKGLITRKVAKGTKNFLKQQAMTEEEALKALKIGIDIFEETYKENKIDIIGVGDMGIGNTTSSSAIISAVTGLPAEETTGRGTGIDEKSLKRKIEVIDEAIKFHNLNPNSSGIEILQKIGGFEIGGIAGTILASAYHKVPVVIDGIIATAAALIAYKINSNVKDYMFASHKSVEKGHIKALNLLGLEPILDLHMRLGEGTGSALAINIIEASAKIMTQMASFEEAGVTNIE